MRVLRFLPFYIVLTLAVSACAADPKPGPNDPPFPEDPVPVEPDKPTGPNCATACDNMRELECEEGQDTSDGATCETVCENTLGTPTAMPVECMTAATECAQTDDCTR